MKKFLTIFFTATFLLGCDKEEVTINTGPLYLGEIMAIGTDEDTGEEIEIDLVPGITKIPLDSRFFIEFSKEVDESTLSSVMLLSNGSEVPASVTLNGTSVIITPSSELAEGERFNLIIADNLMASDGGLFFPRTSIAFRAKGYQFEDQVAYWAFENSLIDSVSEQTGNGNSTAFAEGVRGNALSLDASNQSYMTFDENDVITGLSSFTLSLWVNPTFVDEDDNGQTDGVLGLFGISNINRFWGNIDFFVENNSNPTDGADMRLHITHGNGDGTFSETWISDVNDVNNFFGEWSQHILVYDGETSEFSYYINGTLMTTATASWTGGVGFEDVGPLVFGTVQFQTDPSLTSGAESQGWASYLTGELDEIRLFSVPLSSEEVQELYESENP